MSFYKDVQIALDSRFDALSGSVDIAWENTEYKPVKDTPWMRPTVLFGESDLMDLEDLQLNIGVYQIDFYYPLENGPADLLTQMDAAFDHFKGDLSLTSNGVTVYIKQISRTQPAIREEAWYTASLEITFKCYEN